MKDKKNPGDRKAKPVVAHKRHTKETCERNKARRAKKYAKWLAKRQAKNQAKEAARKAKLVGRIRPKNGGDRYTPSREQLLRGDGTFTILFRDEQDGRKKYLDGLTIEGCNPEGYSNSDREMDGGVLFRTAKGKNFAPRFKEFSFVFNRRADVQVQRETPAEIKERNAKIESAEEAHEMAYRPMPRP